MNSRHRVISAGLALALTTTCTLAAVPAKTAKADPSEELSAAASQLDSLGSELASMQSQLQDATTSLESTAVAITDKQDEIDQTTAQIAELKGQLESGMKSSYKQGSQTIIDVVLGSTSVEDLVSRVYYLDRVSKQQSDTIMSVRDAEARLESEKSELEATQATQQAAVESMQTSVDAYQAKVDEAQAYYDSLDAQVKAQLAEEAARAAEANESSNVSTAVEAIQNSQTSQGATSSGQESSGSGASTTTGGGSSATGSGSGSTSQGGGSTSSGGSGSSGTSGSSGSSSSSGSSVPQGGGVAAAYAALGKPYVYGAAGPNSFDCSGLICYIYGWKYGHSAAAMMNGVRASGNWKTSVSELSVGDLVFPYADGGHVGVYVGNGEYIHAANPSRGVVKDKIWSFVGGGPY